MASASTRHPVQASTCCLHTFLTIHSYAAASTESQPPAACFRGSPSSHAQHRCCLGGQPRPHTLHALSLTQQRAGAGASGVWGSTARWNAKSSGTVLDEDLQAQAWLPSCLRALLAEVAPAPISCLKSSANEGLLLGCLCRLTMCLPSNLSEADLCRGSAGQMSLLTGCVGEGSGVCRPRRQQMRCSAGRRGRSMRAAAPPAPARRRPAAAPWAPPQPASLSRYACPGSC